MAAKTKPRTAGFVYAREAIVIVVDARPPEFRKMTVRDRRTNELVEIDDTESDPVDPGDPGVPYVFKAFQKTRKNHPAVKANPGAFLSEDEVEEDDIVT